MLPDRGDDHGMVLFGGEARDRDRADDARVHDSNGKTAAMIGIVQRIKSANRAEARTLCRKLEAHQQRGLVAPHREVALTSRPVIVIGGTARQGRVEQGPIGGSDVDDHRRGGAPPGRNQRRADLPCSLFGEAGEDQDLSCSSRSSREGASPF